MNKQEIREKHLRLNCLSVNNSVVGKAIQKAAYDAMDEFAQQEVKSNAAALIKTILSAKGKEHLYHDKITIKEIINLLKK